MLLCGVLSTALAADTPTDRPEPAGVQLHGTPTRYMVDLERYRFGGACDVRNPAFHPIPQDTVTCSRDDAEATVLWFEFEPGRVEWMAFNPQSNPLKLEPIETSEPSAFLDQE